MPRFNPDVHFQKITLVGVGLLGGSLGLAVKQRGLASKVDGLVRRSASVTECHRLGVVDHATRDVARAVEGADLIVICTPISRMKGLLVQMLPAMKKGCLVTDVGSVKASVVRELEPMVSKAGGHFVGSHPMAGAEKTGPASARADLFEGAVCVVTPSRTSVSTAVKRIEALWKAVGGVPMTLSAEKHDDLVSRSSHLPHIVAAGLVNYVLSPVHPKTQARLCGTGFRDTTRIASGSPAMWRDIVLANRVNLARVLGVFIADLEEFKHALEVEDIAAIDDFLEKAQQRRDEWAAKLASGPSSTE